ncbi:MAG: ImmA/IrrE family metallo-endopeptidase [Proteobacteria bacterium]|nr:ImmA/IrrE family metallo-endopeptidase [Pseudomonadota bacterium]
MTDSRSPQAKRGGRWYGKRRRGSDPPMSPERRREIADLAEAVSEEFCGAGPVDLAQVAYQKGISTSFGAYGNGFDGMLECRDGRFHIFCNLDRLGSPDSPRARFTMAHELGHYYIDGHRNLLASGNIPPHLSRCEFESSQLAEQEADHFAANLLMPESRFRKAGKGREPGFECILELVKEFGTSLTSTAVRYVSLDMWPAALIKWHWRGYRWKSFSSSMFRRHFSQMFEVPEKLTADCATLKALAQQPPPDCGYFSSGTLSSAWFPFVKIDDFLDVVLVEEAVPMGRYGALTMLSALPDCPILKRNPLPYPGSR